MKTQTHDKRKGPSKTSAEIKHAPTHFADHDHVYCAFCSRHVTGPHQATGQPHGKGQWARQCSACNVVTWYDVVEPDEATPESVTAKLHPARFTEMSGKMAAIVGCICGVTFTEPAIDSLVVTSDNFVLASRHGLANDFIGGLSSLQDNWRRLLDAAELSDEEKKVANAMFLRVVGREPS